MDIVMLQTVPGESINGGRTTQAFLTGATYPVPEAIGQLWIGRGWASAAPRSLRLSPGLSGQTDRRDRTDRTDQTTRKE